MNFNYFAERTSHITQIAALRSDGTEFSCFVMPENPISAKASEVTKIRVVNGKMYHDGRAVPAVTIVAALDSFINFFEDSRKNLLVGHNIRSYDCPILLNALMSCGKLSTFQRNVFGFVDTLKLFKLHHKGLPSYSQTNLVSHFLKDTYSAHDAREDVIALRNLVEQTCIWEGACIQEKRESSFTVDTVLQSLEFSQRISANLPSLQPLIVSQKLTVSMARKIAGSGLNFAHLSSAYQRNGRDGIRAVFIEKCENQVTRVTKSCKVIDSVSQYFESIEE